MKTIIVTGSSRGLGAATAELLAELGAFVVLNARSAAALQAQTDRIRDAGGRAAVVAGDVSRQETCDQLVATAIEETGRLDAVINNAGILGPIGMIAQTDPAAWERNLAINLVAPFRLAQGALPHLRQSQGRIINVSSGAAVHPVPAWGAYCVAKAGLNQLTRELAAEEPGVTSVAVRPGVVDTAMQARIREQGKGAMPADDYARFVRYHEEGDLLPPEVPGRALAVLALYAPADWSGEFLSWDDGEVQELVKRYAPSRGRPAGARRS
jgi:NAD(P)-dependent dehydrogenase (short-subunit alcohol dehydrogenase family)